MYIYNKTNTYLQQQRAALLLPTQVILLPYCIKILCVWWPIHNHILCGMATTPGFSMWGGHYMMILHVGDALHEECPRVYIRNSLYIYVCVSLFKFPTDIQIDNPYENNHNNNYNNNHNNTYNNYKKNIKKDNMKSYENHKKSCENCINHMKII